MILKKHFLFLIVIQKKKKTKNQDATGFKRADLFTMKKSTINKKGHTIKMTIGRKERANKRPSSPRGDSRLF